MCGPLAFGPWLLGAALYFCKSSRRRTDFERQRLPARLSLATCALVILVCIMFTSFMHNQHPECRDDGPHNGSQHGHNRPWHHRARPNCHHPSHPNKEPAGSRQVVAQPASWQKERIPFASLRQGPVRVKAAELEIDKKNLRKTKANMASKMNKEAAKKMMLSHLGSSTLGLRPRVNSMCW